MSLFHELATIQTDEDPHDDQLRQAAEQVVARQLMDRSEPMPPEGWHRFPILREIGEKAVLYIPGDIAADGVEGIDSVIGYHSGASLAPAAVAQLALLPGRESLAQALESSSALNAYAMSIVDEAVLQTGRHEPTEKPVEGLPLDVDQIANMEIINRNFPGLAVLVEELVELEPDIYSTAYKNASREGMHHAYSSLAYIAIAEDWNRHGE